MSFRYSSNKRFKSIYKKEEIRKVDENAKLSALAFKIATDPFVGRLAFLRIYSGTLKAGSTIYNASTGKKRAYIKINADAR